jgi:hypothetical protein
MKNLLAATTLTLAVGTSATAQVRVQDQFHAFTVMACEEEQATLHDLITTSFDMQPLFTGVSIINMPRQGGSETNSLSMMIFYVNQETGQFAVTTTFQDGVTCLLTEGEGFAPYVE